MKPTNYTPVLVEQWVEEVTSHKGVQQGDRLKAEVDRLAAESGHLFAGLPRPEADDQDRSSIPALFTKGAIVHDWPAGQNIEGLPPQMVEVVHGRVAWLDDTWWVELAGNDLAGLERAADAIEAFAPGCKVEHVFYLDGALAPPTNESDLSLSSARDLATDLPEYLREIGLVSELLRRKSLEVENRVVVGVIDVGFDVGNARLRSAVEPQLSATVGGPFPGFVMGIDSLRSGITNHDCHGTACAGIIAAQPQPGSGPRGIAPRSRLALIRLKFAEINSPFYFSQALVLAAGQLPVRTGDGNKVVSCSLGSTPGGRTGSMCVTKAFRLCEGEFPGSGGSLTCFASRSTQLLSRASDEWTSRPSVVLVGSWTELDGVRTKTAGTMGIDLLAPSRASPVVQIPPGSCSRSAIGTSTSTPMVAGAAALLAAQFPRLTIEELRTALKEGAEPMPDQDQNLRPDPVRNGWGRLDLSRALERAFEIDRGEPVLEPQPPTLVGSEIGRPE